MLGVLAGGGGCWGCLGGGVGFLGVNSRVTPRVVGVFSVVG